MKKARSFYINGLPYRPLLILLLLVFFLLASNFRDSSHYSILGDDAYGHLAETPDAQTNVMSKNIGTYVVLFQRVSPSAQSSDNSTLLRFSVTQNSQDTYGVFAALIIKEKSSNNISAQFPYKFYELGDIDYRYTFQNAVDHEVILQARIADDPQYQNNPLVASFDVPVISGVVLGDLALIIIILVLVALPIGIIILILDFSKRTKRGPTPK